MFRTLRSRYILSHILPLLVVVPLMCLTLTYAVETQVLLPVISHSLVTQTGLVVETARDQAGLFAASAPAHAFATRMNPRLDAHLMLLDPAGRLLASTNPADAANEGQTVQLPGLPYALTGQTQIHAAFSQQATGQVIDVIEPVLGQDRQVIGIVRLSYRQTDVEAQIVGLRWLVLALATASIVLGSGLGLVLGVNLERPLRQMSRAVTQLADEQPLEPLVETGLADISQLAKAFNQLEQRRRLLEESRQRLLDNLVHELGRPLGALHSAVQALQGGAYADAALRDELLAGMDGQIRRLTRLVDDLAGLHNQLLGRLELARRPVEVSEWLLPLLALWREVATAKDLRWQVSLPATFPIVEVDPDRMSQALGNLLSNAVKYTPSGGTITVSADLSGASLRIRVSDTGLGIPANQQNRIFEPFYREPGKRFAQGMGLGLSIARDLVVAHGGRLEVDSTPGQGSHFTVWLPVQAK